MHKGNTADPNMLAAAVEPGYDRFRIDGVVFVGDRGMISETRTIALKEQAVGFITSLRATQIPALTVAANFQLSLFDEQGLRRDLRPAVLRQAADRLPQRARRSRARAQTQSTS
ncbi:MAG: hypothetical protein ACLP22_12130 [Solirubrobacteraceae bacterium]